jgi:hypothetical protein
MDEAMPQLPPLSFAGTWIFDCIHRRISDAQGGYTAHTT